MLVIITFTFYMYVMIIEIIKLIRAMCELIKKKYTNITKVGTSNIHMLYSRATGFPKKS